VVPDDDELIAPAPVRTEQLTSLRPMVRKFEVIGVSGPAASVTYTSTGATCAIGSHAGNEIVIDDSSISRSHCELRVEQGHVRIHDLDSTNGTVLDGVRVIAGYVRDGSTLQLGRSTLRVAIGDSELRVAVSSRTELGQLVGTSMAMRACFALLERAAASEVSVLLEGEPGTGKETAAQAIHDHSARKAKPFIAIDCGGAPGNLLEAELFGYEREGVPGAAERRIGALEAATGGTVFLDELGELPSDLQLKLLRVLERGEIRRLGAAEATPIDVRIIAATDRDLRAEVNANRFRSELYFRLAVMKIKLPPLRQRPEDLAVLVERITMQLGVGHEVGRRLTSPGFVAALAGGAWPGNVRELRNYIERAAVIDDLVGVEEEAVPEAETDPQPYQQARDRVLAEFERRYVEQLLRAHHGNVSAAARASGIDRTYLHRLMRRHGLR
jgi:two-component system response regulator GlrR